MRLTFGTKIDGMNFQNSGIKEVKKMSKGLIPNWNDTYGIKIDTDIYDRFMPYKVSVYDTETGVIIASYGAIDIHNLIEVLTNEVDLYMSKL